MDGALWQFGEITTAGWVNFFSAPLIGYLGVSALTVASDYPVRWFFGIVFLVPFTMSILDDWLGLEALVETTLEPLVNEDWGLGAVMVGGLGEAVGALNDIFRAMADPEYVSPGSFDVEYWWVATALWTLLAGAVVALFATRHPDQLPRLRRPG